MAQVIPIGRGRRPDGIAHLRARYDRSRNSLQWEAYNRRRVELFAQLERAAHTLNLEDAIHWLTRLEAHQADRPPGWDGAA